MSVSSSLYPPLPKPQSPSDTPDTPLLAGGNCRNPFLGDSVCAGSRAVQLKAAEITGKLPVVLDEGQAAMARRGFLRKGSVHAGACLLASRTQTREEKTLTLVQHWVSSPRKPSLDVTLASLTALERLLVPTLASPSWRGWRHLGMQCQAWAAAGSSRSVTGGFSQFPESGQCGRAHRR